MIFKAIGRAIKKIGRAIKKVVKKVVKFAKKIVPVALAAAAVYFTAGAALGATSLGWGQAVATGISKLGITGTLGQTLGAAVQYAGTGAMMGAGTALVTGGDVSEGALTGAVLGGLTGGVGHQLGLVSAPQLPGADAAGGLLRNSVPTDVGGYGGGAMPSGAAASQQAATPGLWERIFGGGGTPAQTGTPTEVATQGAGTVASSAPSWLERHGPWVGPVISTVGSGVANYAAATAHEDPLIESIPLIRDVRARTGAPSTGAPLLQDVRVR